MSERYTRLFSLPENLYAEGSPVIIAAGALLKDNQTGKVLAQLKLRSISEKDIQAVKVCLNLFDTALCPIGEPVMFDYLDLRALRDAEFGQKTPVMVPESKARSYTVAVTEVVFSDKSTWTADGAKWEPLPRQKTLESVFQDTELVKQYKIAVGSNFTYYPMQEKDLWFCPCGAVNRVGKPCHVCSRTLPELQAIDREQLVREKDARLAEEARRAAEEKAAADAQRKKTAKILKIVIPAICAVIAFVILLNSVILPAMKERAALKKLEEDYNAAVVLMDAGQYEEAIVAFEAVDGYKDSTQKIEDCETAILEEEYNAAVAPMEEGKYEEAIGAFEILCGYRDSKDRIQESRDAAENLRLQAQYDVAVSLADSGKTAEAAIAFGKLGDYQDARERSLAFWEQIAGRKSIATGYKHSVGLKKDGTVVATGGKTDGQCNVSDWTGIVTIDAENGHTVGLKADGTVIAVGYNDDGQCNVSDWTNIVDIAAGSFQTIGLIVDGTVVAVGWNDHGQCNVSDWTDIVAISAGGYHTVGVKADGTVVAVGNNEKGQCNISNWTDIVDIAAGKGHTVGLKADGTVIAVGWNNCGQCNVSDWTDIVAISADNSQTVGLKADGTVVAVGYNDYDQCDTSNWTDIVAISAGSFHTLGLKADGNVVSAGWNKDDQCDVSDWTDIKLP